MLKSKIEQFVAKKAVICFLLLTIIDIVVFKEKWPALIGLFAGTIISIAKFCSYAWVFGRILGTGAGGGGSSCRHAPGSSIIVFIMNQIILLPLLFLAYFLNHRIFAGFVAGILIVPFILMINGITEALGITKNSFE